MKYLFYFIRNPCDLSIVFFGFLNNVQRTTCTLHDNLPPTVDIVFRFTNKFTTKRNDYYRKKKKKKTV